MCLTSAVGPSTPPWVNPTCLSSQLDLPVIHPVYQRSHCNIRIKLWITKCSFLTWGHRNGIIATSKWILQVPNRWWREFGTSHLWTRSLYPSSRPPSSPTPPERSSSTSRPRHSGCGKTRAPASPCPTGPMIHHVTECRQMAGIRFDIWLKFKFILNIRMKNFTIKKRFFYERATLGNGS